jgi:ABC-2 type transport system permease protein
MGVLEEKASRVVELVLSKIRPSQLLAGKVIGIGLLGLSQLVIVVAVGLTVAIGTGSIDLPPGTAG